MLSILKKFSWTLIYSNKNYSFGIFQNFSTEKNIEFLKSDVTFSKDNSNPKESYMNSRLLLFFFLETYNTGIFIIYSGFYSGHYYQ